MRGSVHTLTEPRRRIEEFRFCQDGHGVMNVHFFSTFFLRVPCTCSRDYNMYDGGAHTLCAYFTHLHACAHTRMAQVSAKRCRLHMCHLCSLSRLLPSHDSRILPYFSRPESAGHAPLRTCIAKFGYLARSDSNTFSYLFFHFFLFFFFFSTRLRPLRCVRDFLS